MLGDGLGVRALHRCPHPVASADQLGLDHVLDPRRRKLDPADLRVAVERLSQRLGAPRIEPDERLGIVGLIDDLQPARLDQVPEPVVHRTRANGDGRHGWGS